LAPALAASLFADDERAGIADDSIEEPEPVDREAAY
jgi:hypothetical protein